MMRTPELRKRQDELKKRMRKESIYQARVARMLYAREFRGYSKTDTYRPFPQYDNVKLVSSVQIFGYCEPVL